MKKTVRIFTVLLLLCLTLPAMLLPASADGSGYDESDNGIIGMTSEEAGWTRSEDGEKLSGCGETFTRYWLPAGYGYRPYSVYCFTESDPEVMVNTTGALGTAMVDGDLYVTNAVRAELDMLTVQAARYCIGYRYANYGMVEAAFEPVLLDAANGKPVELPAGKLNGLNGRDKYVIRAYDSTFSVYASVGELFRVEDMWYYVDYASLPNDRFDADGHVSLRAGTISCVQLTADAAACVGQSVDEMWLTGTYEYENQQNPNPPELRTPAVVMFWISYSLIGFGLPIAALVISLVFANNRKWGKPRRWYLVSGLAGVWMLLSVVLLLLLVL